ncbi:MAG: hypothetical protein ACPG9E_04850 [Poseidonia sp.]
MRWRTAWALVLLLLATPLTVQADSGRAAPTCLEQDAASLAPTIAIDPDVCVIVDLGLLQPGDVYDMSIIVVDDAIDLLFFDENSIQPYELGQSYRSSMAEPASTEFALGAFEFHWKVPPSISAKRWYMVLDNSAHDGDAGQGDQGGQRSTVSVSVAQLNQAYWTPFNDLVAVEAGSYDVLLSDNDLRLDAGTTVVLSAWQLTFSGDVYLQTRSMHDRYTSGGIGVQFIEGGALQAVETPQSLTWQVPASLEGEELLLVVDNTDSPLGGGNGTETLRMTVRLELAPPLTPTITDTQSATVSIGETIALDASSTPNRLNQQGTFTWDLDASVDANNDGDPTNDLDATGITAEGSWSTPGTKTVSVNMVAPSGEEASTTYTVTVVDTVAPTAGLQASGVNVTLVADGWRVNVNNPIQLSCSPSSDDHQIARCDWVVDGVATENASEVAFTPDSVRTYEVELTVTDASGNAGNTTAQVRSVDPTLPRFEPSLLADFPLSATAGDDVEFVVAVSDTYDPSSALRVHWDLQPAKDTDGNGNAKDDADRVGLNPTIAFDTPGTKEIVVTVFDASNNSANYAFSINVASAPVSTTSYTGVVLGAAASLLLVGVVLVSNRAVQRNRGFNLLVEKGLNAEEARARMAMIAQRTKLSLLSKAADYAGLDLGEVVSEEERLAAEKQAEIDAIYGSSNTADPNAGFAPAAYVQAPISEASSQAAAEAAALLSDDEVSAPPGQLLDAFDEEPSSPIVSMPAAQSSGAPLSAEEPPAVALPSSVALPEMEPEAPAVALPSTEGVAMPDTSSPPPAASATQAPTPPPAPAPTLVRHTCTNCGAVFELDMPAGLTRAVVACPGCQVDQDIVSGV